MLARAIALLEASVTAMEPADGGTVWFTCCDGTRGGATCERQGPVEGMCCTFGCDGGVGTDTGMIVGAVGVGAVAGIAVAVIRWVVFIFLIVNGVTSDKNRLDPCDSYVSRPFGVKSKVESKVVSEVESEVKSKVES